MGNHINGADEKQKPENQVKKNNQQEACTDRLTPFEVQKDILIQLYSTMQKELRQLERHFIQLTIPLLTSLGVYGYAVKEFYSKPTDFNNFLILLLGYIASALICIFIYFASTIFAYTYRQNQLVLSKIEDFCCLYTQNLLPPNFNLIDIVSCIDPPELYKLFRCFSFLFLILITLHFANEFSAHFNKLKEQFSLNLLCFFISIVILFIFIIIFICIGIFCLVKGNLKVKFKELLSKKSLWAIYKNKLENLYP